MLIHRRPEHPLVARNQKMINLLHQKHPSREIGLIEHHDPSGKTSFAIKINPSAPTGLPQLHSFGAHHDFSALILYTKHAQE